MREGRPLSDASAILERIKASLKGTTLASLTRLNIVRNLKDLAQLGLTIINPWERRGLARERCYEEMTTR
jgi:hypothetical protein